MELYNKEQIKQIVKNEYNDEVSTGVIDRYYKHYLTRINYHNLLLGGKDKIVVELKLSSFQIKDIVYDFVINCFNSRIANNLYVEVKNNKVYINGKKPIKAILEEIKKYNEEAQKESEIVALKNKSYNLTTVEETLQRLDLTTTFKVIISAKPEDFINCSENTTGWTSCFRKDGDYHTSTNAFYTDDRMLVSYITTANGRKIGRRWLHIDYNQKVVCSGKQYGTYSEYVAKSVREYVQALINKDVKWYSFKQEYVHYEVQACYKDSSYTVSYIKGNKDTDYCMYSEMEDGLDYNDEVNKGKWFIEDTICEECGRRHNEDDSYYIEQGGYYVCSDCIDNYTYCNYHYRFEVNEDNEFYQYGRYSEVACTEGAIDSGHYVRDIDCNIIKLYDAIYLEDCDEYVHKDSDDAIYLEDCDEYVHKDSDDAIYLEDTEQYVSKKYPYIKHNGNYYSENYIIKEEDNEETN